MLRTTAQLLHSAGFDGHFACFFAEDTGFVSLPTSTVYSIPDSNSSTHGSFHFRFSVPRIWACFLAMVGDAEILVADWNPPPEREPLAEVLEREPGPRRKHGAANLQHAARNGGGERDCFLSSMQLAQSEGLQQIGWADDDESHVEFCEVNPFSL